MQVFTDEFKKFIQEQAENVIEGKVHEMAKIHEVHVMERNMKLIIVLVLSNFSIRDKPHPPLLEVDDLTILSHPNHECYRLKLPIEKNGGAFPLTKVFDSYFK